MSGTELTKEMGKSTLDRRRENFSQPEVKRQALVASRTFGHMVAACSLSIGLPSKCVRLFVFLARCADCRETVVLPIRLRISEALSISLDIECIQLQCTHKLYQDFHFITEHRPTTTSWNLVTICLDRIALNS